VHVGAESLKRNDKTFQFLERPDWQGILLVVILARAGDFAQGASQIKTG